VRVIDQPRGGIGSPSVEECVHALGTEPTEVQPNSGGAWTAIEAEGHWARVVREFGVSVAVLICQAVVDVKNGGAYGSIFFVDRKKPRFCGVGHGFAVDLD